MRFIYGLAGVVLILAVVCYPVLVLSYSSGPLPGLSGGPSGFGTCVQCHSSFPLDSGTGSVKITAPSTFVPGETIEFTITVDNTTPLSGTESRQGFEVSVEDYAAAAHVGTLVLVDTTTQFASDTYVTHNSDGNMRTSWTVGWTAPEDAPETVTIYAAGNAANFDGGPFGDYIYTDSLTMARVAVANEDEAQPAAARLGSAFPNPFAAATNLTYTLDRPMAVTVTLYDGVGRVVRVLEEGARGVGTHPVEVSGAGLAAGTYFVQLRSEEGAEVRALTLSR